MRADLRAQAHTLWSKLAGIESDLPDLTFPYIPSDEEIHAKVDELEATKAAKFKAVAEKLKEARKAHRGG